MIGDSGLDLKQVQCADKSHAELVVHSAVFFCYTANSSWRAASGCVSVWGPYIGNYPLNPMEPASMHDAERTPIIIQPVCLGALLWQCLPYYYSGGGGGGGGGAL